MSEEAVEDESTATVSVSFDHFTLQFTMTSVRRLRREMRLDQGGRQGGHDKNDKEQLKGREGEKRIGKRGWEGAKTQQSEALHLWGCCQEWTRGKS